jgi:hypothetical protein
MDIHLKAELASLDGDSDELAAYFKRNDLPNSNVLRAVARQLLPGQEWKLQFRPRNGRPPKDISKADLPWAPSHEQILSRSLDALASALDAQSVEPQTAHSLARRLGEALAKSGPSKYRLVYKRPRVGNPSRPEMTALKKELLGVTLAEDAHLRGRDRK